MLLGVLLLLVLGVVAVMGGQVIRLDIEHPRLLAVGCCVLGEGGGEELEAALGVGEVVQG